MRRRPPNTPEAKTRKRALLLLALALAALSTFGASALAKTLSERLSAVEQQRTHIASGIAGLNKQVDQLIGQLSGLRQREAAIQAQLNAKQAELAGATAQLKAEQRHLAILRARLERARKVLSDRLVEIYKSGQPDVISIVLNSASFTDVISESDYFDSIKNADNVIIDRVQGLQEQTAYVVDRLRAARVKIKKAEKEIQVQRDQAATARAEAEARQADLEAARRARQKALAPLNLEAQKIQVQLSKQGQVSGTGIPNPSGRAKLLPNGQAVPPDNAPGPIRGAIAAANSIATKPYVWGGGHGSFQASGYDCSGAVSFALHGGGFLSSPLDSTGLEVWGSGGYGRWISVFANSGHAWMIIAGLRFDTSGTGGSGPRWSTILSDPNGPFVVRHPSGY
jgi:peptidoglycan hydrolase CwlO-like protein